MANRKKKKKRTSEDHALRAVAQEEARERLRKSRLKTVVIMVSIFLVLGIGYYALLSRYVFWATPVLYSATAVLFLVFFFVNRGFSAENVSRETKESTDSTEFTDSTESIDSTEFADSPESEKAAIRRAFARVLMIVLIPMLLLVAADMMLLIVLPMLGIEIR